MTTGIETGWVWAVGFAVFVLGVVIGTVLGYLALGDNRKARELQNRLDALQQEFDQYKEKVSSHFLHTSELVQKMTSSYREVYEHLASGSEALCDIPVATPQLDFPDRTTLDAKQAPDSETGPAPEPQPVSVADQFNGEEQDEVLGDAPQVPDLDLEIPRQKSADSRT